MENGMSFDWNRRGWWLAAPAVAAAAGALVPSHGLLIVAAMAGAGLAVFAAHKPDTAIVFWLVVVAVVPSWTEFYGLGFGLPPAALGVPIVVGILGASYLGKNPVRIGWVDGALAAASILVLFLSLTGELHGVVFVRDLLVLWILAYVLGRNSTARVTSSFALIMAGVALWGIVEFLSGMHLFVDWMPGANQTLNAIQERSGVARSEAAFGHAIAYGASLAMAIPFAQQLRKGAVAVQIVLALGIVASLSRGPLLALAVTFALTAWVLASHPALRLRYMLLTLVGGATVYFVLGRLYSGVDSDQVAGSGEMRINQYDAIGGSLHWLSSALEFTGVNQTPLVNGILVIDSTPLRLAANFGIIAAVLFAVPVLIALARVIGRKAGPASVALAGQIPVLAVTSFITQWQVLIFFAMGLVATEVMQDRIAPSLQSRRETDRVPRAVDHVAGESVPAVR
ncbi:hypothetical protein A5N75_10990 [Prescottella equi]|nr:hypothetical protein A6F56_09300 [Prescottella equi]ORL09634.1 hypothetical protein A6I84_05965 [Prescottella equi]ORL39623.1 hypothetical protein A6F59_19835 [Prescottella equi]ORL75892.1 hypothetical protein A5N75_10990 [Prescottella equi]ORL95276.1 hypothetical protein A5N76_07690 [Prescottella equi]